MTRWLTIFLAAAALAAGQAAPQAAAQPAGDAEAGHDLYAQNCRACHSGAIAPLLKGVFGRPIASVPDYAYSDALKAKTGQNWTAANLDSLLAGPDAFAPGTRMMMVLADPKQRADVIAYLQSLSSPD